MTKKCQCHEKARKITGRGEIGLSTETGRRDGERRGNGLEINHNEEVEGCGKKRGPFFRCDAFVSEAKAKKLEIKECPDAAALKPDRREERWQHAVIFLLFLIKGAPSSDH